ncbi:MAG: hypothetical protein ACRD8W_18275 [Nitrososphaeraceae archaeon]
MSLELNIVKGGLIIHARQNLSTQILSKFEIELLYLGSSDSRDNDPLYERSNPTHNPFLHHYRLTQSTATPSCQNGAFSETQAVSGCGD